MDVKNYSDQLVQDLVQGPWETLMDEPLRNLTRAQFEAMAPEDTNEEALADAWYEFGERRARVFG